MIIIRLLLKKIIKLFLYLLAAITFGVALRVFLLASFLVPTPSMSPTIEPGDFVLVNKLIPGPWVFTSWGFLDGSEFRLKRLHGLHKPHRNEVLVFNFPHTDGSRIRMDMETFYAKRCIAVAGDTLRIINGTYRVNSQPDTFGFVPAQRRLSKMTVGQFSYEVFRCFPYNPHYDWNILNFGPLYIPAVGYHLALDTTNICLYRELIEYETDATIDVRNADIMLNDSSIHEYTFRHNYYFMAGDYVFDSRDSRYWGLLPEDHIVGKAFVIWKSKDMETGNRRWKRYLRSL